MSSAKQLLKDTRQIACVALRKFGKDASAECTQPVLNVMHVRRRILFVVSQNPSPVVFDVAAVIHAFIAIHSDQPRKPAVSKNMFHGMIVASEVGIAVEDEKLLR